MPDGLYLALAAVFMALWTGIQQVGHSVKVLGQKVGHELKYEPPKVLHLLGIHRGHLKKDGRKI